MLTMHRALILLVALAAFVAAERDSAHSVTKRLVTTHPVFGQPVACLVREALESPRSALAIQRCSASFCNCVNGTLSSLAVNSSRALVSPGSLQCNNPRAFNQAARPWNTSCNRMLSCYHVYIECIGNAARGCVQPVLEQCNEAVFRQCDEGRICKFGDLPNNLGAGAVFAITIGCFLFVFLLLFCATCLIGRKNRKALDEPL